MTETDINASNTSGTPKVEDSPPMTSAQADVLRALCEDQGKNFDPTLGQSDAADRITDMKSDQEVALPTP